MAASGSIPPGRPRSAPAAAATSSPDSSPDCSRSFPTAPVKRWRPRSTCTGWPARSARAPSAKKVLSPPTCCNSCPPPWRSVSTYRTASEDETIALGERLAAELPRHGVVLLIGNLGAGKTTLAKGIVRGRGAAQAEEVSSPTFTLIHEYRSPERESSAGSMVYHIDLYRLDEPRQVATLGLDELFDRDALVLIEWGERFPQLMPAARTEIRIRSTGDDAREIEGT